MFIEAFLALGALVLSLTGATGELAGQIEERSGHLETSPAVVQVVHRPYRDGNCGACHTDSSPAGQSLKAPINQLCGNCHSPGDGFNHPVNDRVTCASCHDPHQSSNAKLLARAKDGLCIVCHDLR